MEDKFAKLKETIKECAFNEEQIQEANNKLNEIESKVNKVISTLVYNRDWGKRNICIDFSNDRFKIQILSKIK